MSEKRYAVRSGSGTGQRHDWGVVDTKTGRWVDSGMRMSVAQRSADARNQTPAERTGGMLLLILGAMLLAAATLLIG